MDVNQYALYAQMTEAELKTSQDSDNVKKILEKFKDFNTDKEVKEFLKSTWGIKELVQNYPCGSNVTLSLISGEKYFNVTFQSENHVKSYNYDIVKD